MVNFILHDINSAGALKELQVNKSETHSELEKVSSPIRQTKNPEGGIQPITVIQAQI